MMRSGYLLAVFAISLGACGAGATTVPVEGADPDVLRLAGEWKGTYTGVESGRTGEVTFNLDSGRHSADGEVIMGETGKPLKIRFIQVADDEVNGTIDPYQDPICSCQVETQFHGTIVGDSISGTFTTNIPSLQQVQTGSWLVARPGT